MCYSISGCPEGIALHSFLQQPCRTFRTNRCVALVPCECKPKGNNCIQRILCSLAQLYTLIYVLRTAFCYCDQWLRPRPVCQFSDALLCSSVYRHLIDALQDSMSGWWMRTMKQNSGFHEHLSQYHVLMWGKENVPLWEAGFRRGRGVTDHVVKLGEHVGRAVGRRKVLLTCFFDISRASTRSSRQAVTE